jgi:hypothetical protein
MRSFSVLLLIPFFLALTRAVPVSKKLSAAGSYPRSPSFDSPFLIINALFPLEAALVDPTQEHGFIPRDVWAYPATPPSSFLMTNVQHWWFRNGGPVDKE